MSTIEGVHARREWSHTGFADRHGGRAGKTGSTTYRPAAWRGAPPCAPVRTRPARGASSTQRPHLRVLIVADFVSTSEEFHRRLIWLARLLGTKISLIQLPTDPDARSGDPTSAILLEGLRERLGVPAEICSIAPSRSIDAMLRSRYLQTADLVLLGRAHGPVRFPDCVDLAARMRNSGCEAIVIDDRPEWEWRR